ncbi:hypothetical protein DUNSADRAFT_7207 [Dunaliella salina]|uniref:TIR domain-containing protein n=1 Tax=Dunaliella salina TaxID=3046 RepID=A0ABQ7GLR4_DUNSA|nr:hypothetical protein DUNSADRAFT_7207 [Dunaliella salina]|eukprot:KAF5835554.1 hypothetical protein DUNSADRAFT_7207 [Dunaliella salina]
MGCSSSKGTEATPIGSQARPDGPDQAGSCRQGRRPEDFSIFLSFRVKESEPQALAFKRALESRGYSTFCSSCDICSGDDWVRTICSALTGCQLVVVLATRSYGAPGTNAFATSEELATARREKKDMYIVPMTDYLEESVTRVLLGTMQKGKSWTTAPDIVPDDLLDDLLSVCKQRGMNPDLSSNAAQNLQHQENASLNGSQVQGGNGVRLTAPESSSAAQHVAGKPKEELEGHNNQEEPEVHKMTTSSLPDLQQKVIDATKDTQKEHIFDLAGFELTGTLSGNLMLPSRCALRNGKIHLPDNAKICASGSCNASFTGISIMGAHLMDCALEVLEGSTVAMADCEVSGGGKEFFNAAVRLHGPGSKLSMHMCSLQSEGDGLNVQDGGTAILKSSKMDGNGGTGVYLEGKGSSLEAHLSSISSNGWHNSMVKDGASAKLRQCTLDGSKNRGLYAVHTGTTVKCSACSISLNEGSNVFAGGGAKVLLLDGCKAHGSKDGYGWAVWDEGSTIMADRSSTAEMNAAGVSSEEDGGRIFLRV